MSGGGMENSVVRLHRIVLIAGSVALLTLLILATGHVISWTVAARGATVVLLLSLRGAGPGMTLWVPCGLGGAADRDAPGRWMTVGDGSDAGTEPAAAYTSMLTDLMSFGLSCR